MERRTLQQWLDERPAIRVIQAAAGDLNALPRGKWMPRGSAARAIAGELRFPKSVLNLDLWGEDIEESPLVFAQGDPDGILRPTERGFVPVPWLEAPAALLPLWMFEDDGTPFAGDPRHALARIVDRLRARGLEPVVAMELEFHLIDDLGPEPQVPPSPRSGKRRARGEILSLRVLDAFDRFFDQLYAACEAMDIPADALISESGIGQFEINLRHQPDALKAADDAWLFRMLVKGLARRHGFGATFAAKPYPDEAGSGLHVHFSLADDAGRNLFDERHQGGEARLMHAIAGCLRAMAPMTAIFAPLANSYERFVPGAHAPTDIAWAWDNRTTAIRIPAGPPGARRIEHRVAAGDANPYLLLAAILGGALLGIEEKLAPPPPVSGNAWEQDLPRIPQDWASALDLFEREPLVRHILPDQLVQNFLLTKRQELRCMAEMSPEECRALHIDAL